MSLKHFLACLLVLIGSAQLATAQTPRDYVLQGDDGAARTALAELVGGTAQAALHFAFLDGLILVRDGQVDQAIAIFREILNVEPNFEPARRELTVLLARTGRIEGAIFHAERLVGTTLDERLRNDLQNFILHKSGVTQPP